MLFSVISSAKAETLNFTTYYPSPSGQYDRLRLVPRATAPTCDVNTKGLFYYNNTVSRIEVCGDSGEWEPIGGTWTKDANNYIYPTGTPSDPEYFVGIGTTTPQAPLHVEGRFNLNLGQGNILLGYNAGLHIPSDDNQFRDNIAIGYSAASVVSSESLASYENILIGKRSGERITGYGNVAIGTETLRFSSGVRNIAVGYGALSQNTTASDNIAIGGDQTMVKTTIGGDNIGIGSEALKENIEGIQNTVIGKGALRDNESDRNTALGAFALQENVDGSNNLALGVASGFHNVSGSNNVFIGYYAGFNGTESDKLYIANSAAKTLIYGDFSTDRVGINTTSPQATLDVNGGVKISNDTDACNASKEGTQRYNSTSKQMEFCNGTAWQNMSGGGGGTFVGRTLSGFSR